MSGVFVKRGGELVQELRKADWRTAAIFKDPDGDVNERLSK